MLVVAGSEVSEASVGIAEFLAVDPGPAAAGTRLDPSRILLTVGDDRADASDTSLGDERP